MGAQRGRDPRRRGRLDVRRHGYLDRPRHHRQCQPEELRQFRAFVAGRHELRQLQSGAHGFCPRSQCDSLRRRRHGRHDQRGGQTSAAQPSLDQRRARNRFVVSQTSDPRSQPAPWSQGRPPPQRRLAGRAGLAGLHLHEEIWFRARSDDRAHAHDPRDCGYRIQREPEPAAVQLYDRNGLGLGWRHHLLGTADGRAAAVWRLPLHRKLLRLQSQPGGQ